MPTRLAQALLLLAVSAAAIQADAPESVKTLLSRPVLEPGTPLAEVQRFVESRVPPMPVVGSVAEWEKHADRMRSETLARVIFRGEAAGWRDAKTRVKWLETIDGGPGYRIRKVRYEALPGLWIPALLYEPEKMSGKVPVVLNVNGHDRANGKAAGYKQTRCINQAKRGMLALNVEWLGMGQLHTDGFGHSRMNQLNLCGTSGLAPFYLSMSRGIDLLLDHPHADRRRVAVAGLSGGGWQTIFISALDTRVTLCNPVAGYSSYLTRTRNFSDLGDSEQTPCDLATVTDYAQLTAMLAPRATLLTFNATDNGCFAAGHALPPLLAAARPIFELYGKRAHLWAHVNFNPGNHNFGRDNREALYRMFGRYFFDGSRKFDPREIQCDDELKTKAELKVAVPDDNADFHSLATAIARGLPQRGDVPEAGDKRTAWQADARKRLAETVRTRRSSASAELVGEAEAGETRAGFWKLRIGGDWTVPVVELVRGQPERTTILVADKGRAEVARTAESLLKNGHRVLAVDPFYFGESRIRNRDYLFALLVSTVGDRPLGLQARQLAAIARWDKSQTGKSPALAAVGPRTSLGALVAAGLEPDTISGLTLHGSYKSLKQVIRGNMGVNEAPELFCFGLLEQFDIEQLEALVSPRSIKQVE